MELKYNDKSIFTLSETQKKVIKNDIPSDIFESDMTRRCKYWLESPCEKYVHGRQEEMCKSLKEKNEKTIPTNKIRLGEKYADLFPCPCGYSDITNSIVCFVGNESFELSSAYRKIWRKMGEEGQHDIDHEEYLAKEEEILSNRMAEILQHKYERCLERLRLEWLPKLEERGIESIPTDDEEFAELVFSQRDYKNRSQKDAESDGLR